MAARLIEGFEHSTAVADYAGKWTSLTGAVSSAAGRYGNGFRSTSTAHNATKTLDAQATWVMGCAFRNSSLANVATVLAVLDAGTVQALLHQQTDGTLIVCRGTTATVLGTTPGACVSAGVWVYLEWRITVGNTGSSVVRVNGVEVLNLPSADTQQTANATANQVRVNLGASAATFDVDDVYVFDTTGSTNTAFIGDCRVERLAPSGAGATTAWTPSAGSNYQCVDEAPPTADTDYVSSATAGQTDTYAFGNLATTSGTVYAVQASAIARKDDAGTRSLALVARPGSTDRVGATQGVADAYASYVQVWDVNPDTSAAWTIAGVNASEWGQRLIA